jgi:hypothetical protein
VRARGSRSATVLGALLLSVVLIAGLVGQAQAASLTFLPVADTYVSQSAPYSSEVGDWPYITASASPARQAYLKFQLSGLGGPPAAARLRLYALRDSAAGGAVVRMTDTDWSETTTWYSKPDVAAPVLATLGPVVAGQWYEVDVTPAVAGNGTLSLALTDGAGTEATYAAREDAAHAPRLVVTTGAASTPTRTTTPVPTSTPRPTSTPTPGNAAAGRPCPQALHDSHVTTGPDGKSYPTWHPAVDPQSGCFFGHEHGADPRTSRANAAPPAFGYVGALAGTMEPHAGFKVFVWHHGEATDLGPVPADVRAVFHMGTGGVKRYTERFHSLQFDFIARDGTGREAHVAGMADTGTAVGSTCDNPRKDGRDFSTVGCNDPYEIWGNVSFQVIHPDDAFTDIMHTRLTIIGAFAAFDPILTRDPADNNRVLYTLDYRDPASAIDPTSASSPYRGCDREAYAGPNFWNNAGSPTVYYTDPYGRVQPGPGPGLIRQTVSAVDWNANSIQYKLRRPYCAPGVHAPN